MKTRQQAPKVELSMGGCGLSLGLQRIFEAGATGQVGRMLLLCPDAKLLGKKALSDLQDFYGQTELKG